MEYLQYLKALESLKYLFISFKPCYKWNTFNTIISYNKNLGGSKF